VGYANFTPCHVAAAQAATGTQLPFLRAFMHCLASAQVTRSQSGRFTSLHRHLKCTICRLTAKGANDDIFMNGMKILNLR
jgi:hypothetical protein